MSPLSKALERLIIDLWNAGRDPAVMRDAAAQARWRTYAEQRAERILQAELERRLQDRGEA